jgi:aminopeptidase N
LRSHILDQDIVYVGGGNTKSMLAVWREWGLDVILKEAYNKNIILSGVSAGAICWFDKGITDSWKESQATLNCLGFVSGVCCPHYDEEPERIPYVKKILTENQVNEVYAIEGYAALHIIDDVPRYSISFKNDTHCHKVSITDDSISHTSINGIIRIDL